METKRFVCTRDLNTANLRPALEQGCGKQRPRARKLFFRANLLYVPNIKMQRRLRCRSVHNFGTCVWRTAAQWQNPICPALKNFFFLEVATAHWFSKRKSQSCAKTYISVSSTFRYSEHIANLLEKKIPSALRLLSTALLERWPLVCRVKITFTVLPKNHFVSTTKKMDEMRCKLDSTENLRSFEEYPTPP